MFYDEGATFLFVYKNLHMVPLSSDTKTRSTS